MKCRKYLIILILMFICRLQAAAQDSEYVYKDVTVLHADSVAAASLEKETQTYNAPAEPEVTDTFLQNKQLLIYKDSAEGLKKDAAFNYARNLDSILIALQKKQLAHQQPEKPVSSWSEKFFFSPATKIFFSALACFFIGFIVYKLFITEGVFQRHTVRDAVTVLPEAEEEIFASADYGKLIAQATADENYPLAIRYHYLQTLQKLAAKNIIQFTPDKTNYGYVRELAGKPYRDQFAALTNSYEYAWYGKFDISAAMFSGIREKFKQFNNQF
jgi:hypothetical protein